MRSILCVPANKPSMVEKSEQYECDQIILDLEDSVLESEKIKSRQYLLQYLNDSKFTRNPSIRINELSSAQSVEDLALIAKINVKKLGSVIIPKAHSLKIISKWVELLPPSVKIEAQIESALGLINASEIASHPQVISLAFGPVDFMHSVGMPSAEPGIPSSLIPGALQWPLLQVIIAAHAHGKLAYDGPSLKINDQNEFVKAAEISRALGADGKWLIHPNQIASCNQIFSPSNAEIETATAIIQALNASSGAAAIDGLMIDEASLKIANQLLENVTRIRK